MTTWTMAQVSAAGHLRASLLVDLELLERNPEATKQAAEDEMAKHLTHMAHAHAIELHRGDFEVTWERDSSPWQAKGTMRWHPLTNTAELRGGHADGQRYAIQRIGDPLHVPRIASTPWMDVAADRDVAALTEMSDIYELVGWREDERVWVYEAS